MKINCNRCGYEWNRLSTRRVEFATCPGCMRKVRIGANTVIVDIRPKIDFKSEDSLRKLYDLDTYIGMEKPTFEKWLKHRNEPNECDEEESEEGKNFESSI